MERADQIDRTLSYKLKFIIALISEYAKAYELKQSQAFNYLNRFKGLDFLLEHYDYMHTQSFEDTIESLNIVCRRNGGRIQ